MFRLIALLLALCAAARADIVHLRNGNQLEGRVIAQDTGGLTLRMAIGTVTLSPADVAWVESKPFTMPPPRKPGAESRYGRIPSVVEVAGSLRQAPWAKDVQQIPATVIDNGVMRNVPYLSYRASDDYEVNVYGDPAAPAAIEIGVYRGLLNSDEAKRRCVEFICALLPQVEDQGVVRELDLSKDLKTRGPVTFEVTPETAEDAYGGWWISVYDEKALDLMRASEKEMAQITVPRQPKAKEPAAAPREPGDDSWSGAELSRSRAPRSPGGGTVYVRSYYRKDGTYVHAHTRSAPHRRR